MELDKINQHLREINIILDSMKSKNAFPEHTHKKTQFNNSHIPIEYTITLNSDHTTFDPILMDLDGAWSNSNKFKIPATLDNHKHEYSDIIKKVIVNK